MPSELMSAEHVTHCLRCQAEIAAQRRLRRVTSTLIDAPAEAPPGLATDILRRLDEVDADGPTSRVPAVAAATIGGLAAAAGAIAMVSRHRRVMRIAG